MKTLNALPGLLVAGALVGVATLMARGPFFRRQLAADGDRADFQPQLEGLRGLLALAVFLHHTACAHQYWQTSVWVAPAEPFYDRLGPFAVTLFFFITGYLFWSRVLEQGKQFEPRRFLSHRFRRLAPAYFFSLIPLLLLIGARCGWHFDPAPGATLFPLLGWLAFGLPNCVFAPVSHVYSYPINGNIQWTLSYEWEFYLLLPFIAALAPVRRFIPFAIASVVIALVPTSAWFQVDALVPAWARGPLGWQAARDFLFFTGSGFIYGMLAALLEHRGYLTELRRPGIAAAGAVSLCIALVWGPREMSPLTGALLFVPFLAVVAGSRAGGILVLPGVRFLGRVSYSFYLLHAMAIYLVLELAFHGVPGDQLGPTHFWLLMLCAGLLTTAVSSASFRWIEHQFYRSRSAGRTVDVISRSAVAPALREIPST